MTEHRGDHVLRSTYDPAAGTISLELEIGRAGLPAGARLAVTSVVQLTPGATSDAELGDRLATYHEFTGTRAPLSAGANWAIPDLTLSHRPHHANDGPVSCFVILPDDGTVPVVTTPMVRLGDAPQPTGTAGTATTAGPAAAAIPVVPYPTSIGITDDEPLPHRAAHLIDGPDTARNAWQSVSQLVRRIDHPPALGATTGVAVTAVDDPTLPDEGYRLSTGDGRITIAAASASGFRHAFVTLARWLPGGLPRRLTVEDRPTYSWRGLHIDLARQWFEPGVVERLIDVAAWRKLSRLHLHLTDDEAWRLPVDGYPELTAVAATRGHRRALPPMLGGTASTSGRAYTAAEIARWVERADALGVTLVPEVDLPAHNHAALTALPRLRDPADRSGAVSVQWFTDNVLVPGHPLLPDFLDAVVDSVTGLFPSSPWIHIGGDEVPEGAWSGSPIVAEFRARHGHTTTRDVEGAFHRDLVDRLHRCGRRPGAWQEAAESGGVRPDDGYVVGWRTPEASRQLAAAGYDVVVAPGQAYYLDMAIDDRWDRPGAAWAGTVSLDDACHFVPDAGWTDDERSHLLGVQACLWSEHVTHPGLIDELLFPRLDAIAERAWSGEIAGGPESLASRAG